MDVVSVYVHIPFCRSKCAYCDFNSYAGLEHLYDPYVQALARDIRLVGEGLSLQARTIYLGGGTPTVLPLSLVDEALSALRQAFRVTSDVEVAIEANPGAVDSDYLAGLLNLGVNRLSFGVQSLDDGLLRILGRIHTAAEIDRPGLQGKRLANQPYIPRQRMHIGFKEVFQSGIRVKVAVSAF